MNFSVIPTNLSSKATKIGVIEQNAMRHNGCISVQHFMFNPLISKVGLSHSAQSVPVSLL